MGHPFPPPQDGHINVELTFNVRSIKYIQKYLYKGYDRTTMELGQNRDELKQYLDTCYVLSGRTLHKVGLENRS